MAFIIKDRVKEATASTGTGAVTLGGASATFDPFNSYMVNGDTTYYAIVHTSSGVDEWEVGLGTWNTGNTLTRTTILSGSNGSSAVDFSAGTKNIFMTYPAEHAALAGDDVSFANITVTGTVDGRDVATDGTKLDTVEQNADVTDSINVAAAGALMKSGGTMTGDLILNGDPTAALGAATKEYVDTIAAAGIHYHTPVRVEAPLNLTVTYDNGTNGVGATLTNAGTQEAITIDGVALSLNDRVLVYEQTDATQNGIYTVTTVGDGSTNWVLTRATDADTYGASDPDSFGEGDAFFVKEGATGAGELYVMNTSGTITFGTTDITFTVIAETAVYSAGTGMSLTGTTFSIGQAVGTTDNVTFNQVTAAIIGNVTGNLTGDVTGNADTASALETARTIQLTGDVTGSTSFDGSGNVSITATVQDDSHSHVISNVDGLQTELDGKTPTSRIITAGNGLTGGGDLTANRTISHADTSTQASLTALTGAAVVSDVDVDTYGHVTNLSTRNMTLADLGYTGETNATADQTITAGNGLTGGGTGNVTLNHADTSSQASVDNSGATVIQDVTLDTYGHVTGLASTALTPAIIGAATSAQGALADSAVQPNDSPSFGDITTSGTVDGRDVAADGTKLDGIEAGATADQTAGEIKTAYESNANTNAFTDAEQSKLAGIEAGADVTDTTNVTAAGALMDSEVTNLAQVKAFDSADYATAAQGTLADSAVQPNDTVTLGAVTATSFTGDGSGLTGLPAGYTNADVDTHLNTGTASTGEYLSWNGSDYDWVAVSAGYTNADVDTHLNTGTASTGEVLSWNGSDYDWTSVSSKLFDDTTAPSGENKIAGAGSSYESFGSFVAVGSEKIIAYSGASMGLVYVFDLDGTQTAVLTPTPAGGSFGRSLAVGSGRIVVGAETDGGQGSVYIFDLSGTQLSKITAPDIASNDRFGASVAVGSDRIVVGSEFDDDNGATSGSAYIYDLNGNLLSKITASDGASNHRFGTSVAVGSGRIVVGAVGASAAYIFDLNGNQLSKITASDSASNFGGSVSLGSGRIVVGCSGYDSSGLGRAYIFDLYGLEIAKITSGVSYDYFASYGVSVGSGRVVVGAFYAASGQSFAVGKAYVFDLFGNLISSIEASDGSEDAQFGYSVAVGSGKIVIGASGESSAATFAGAAYIYNTPDLMSRLELDNIITGSYTGDDVDTHLNTAGAEPGASLTWNGSGYEWSKARRYYGELGAFFDKATGIGTFSISTLGNAGVTGTLSSTNGGGVAACGDSNIAHVFCADVMSWSFYTQGNSVDIGEIYTPVDAPAAVSDGYYGVIMGGDTSSNNIRYTIFDTVGNAVKFGQLATARTYTAGVSNGIRGATVGGNDSSSSPINSIEYITISSLSGASSFGSLVTVRGATLTAGNRDRALVAGGWTQGGFGGTTTAIDYLSLGTLANASSFGSLSYGRFGGSGVNNETRAVFGGGFNSSFSSFNSLDYVTIATLGTASSFGTMAAGSLFFGGASGTTYG